MRQFAAVDEHKAHRLRELLPIARHKAEQHGPIHALWDLVFDAEAMLKGFATIADWHIDDLIRELERHIE